MKISQKVSLVSYQNPESGSEFKQLLEKFGEYFFDGEKVYINTEFKSLKNTADPYAEVANWYEVGENISKDLCKYKIGEFVIDLEIDQSSKFDLALGLYQGVWEYDQEMKNEWKLKVDGGFDKLTEQKLLTQTKGMYLCKNFVMLPNQFLPTDFSEIIRAEFANSIANIEVMNEGEMRENGLLACLSVNNGSKKQPQFITIQIHAKQKVTDNIVVVGKCLYDVGGLALKGAEGQREMYIDKGGAATALGMAKYFAEFPLEDKNLIFLLPAVRNEVSDTSYLNGEVITVGGSSQELKKNVEIGNTDAEGRLTLADAVVWGQVKYNAKEIVTIATLTGASLRSHGNAVGSIFCNRLGTKEKAENSFVKHSEQAEVFPFRVRYSDILVPDNGVAEMSNISNLGQVAGHHSAAEFVRKFITDDVDLTHVDMAGPVIDKKGVATGYGVRSLIGLLEG